MHQKSLFGDQKSKKNLWGGAVPAPQTPPPVGRGHLLPTLHPSRRLRCLESARAFGARPPQTLSLPPKLAVNRIDAANSVLILRLVAAMIRTRIRVSKSALASRLWLRVLRLTLLKLKQE